MTENSDNPNRVDCSPETLIRIKDQRIQFAEHTADVNLGAYIELKEQMAQMIATRDERIADLERQLVKVNPDLSTPE